MALDYLYTLLNLDVKSLMGVLFWGNLTSCVLVLSSRFVLNRLNDRDLFITFSLAKICQAMGFVCILLRGALPDFISVNIGNSWLFTGFYFEAFSMLLIVQEKNTKLYQALHVLFGIAVLLFNGVEYFHPSAASFRVATASLGMFLILLLPTLRMVSQKTDLFKRISGAFYLAFILLLLPRAAYSFLVPITVLSDAFILALNELALVILMMLSLSAYILFMKESSDRVIAVLATTDSLTALPNRRAFLDIAERTFVRHRVGGLPLTVLFLDIDHFKHVNDTYGHPFGDQVLVALGAVIRMSLRAGDIPCRYGGEEFVALLPGADKGSAVHATQRIMNEVAALKFQSQPDFSFTVSIGVMSGVPVPGDALEGYLDKADKALYHAKVTGRNRVVEYRCQAGKPDITDFLDLENY